MRTFVRVLARRTMRSPGVLPDFLILGAQRSGTSFLWQELLKHPNVRGSDAKEMRFFDDGWARGTARYRVRFPRGSENAADRGWIAGEATPSYLFHPLAPTRAARVLPSNVALVVLLRHPVDRAWSHYCMMRERGVETATFDEAIGREQAHYSSWLDCASSGGTSLEFRRFSYLHRGCYSEQLRRWQQAFPPDRFLVLRAESMFADPGAVYGTVLGHIGLEPVEGHGRFATPRPNSEEIGADARDRLTVYYEDELGRLRDEFGISWE